MVRSGPRAKNVTMRRAAVGGNASASCPLTLLAHKLHLACFMAADHYVLTRHFVKHYRERVGVWPGRMRFWVHDATNGTSTHTREAVEGLLSAGVEPESLVLEITPRWSDKLLLRVLNQHISMLPKDHWLIHANIDEFFYFPCDMMARLQMGQQLFCMCMQDRLAASGKVTAMTSDGPDLELQYPLSCYVRPFLRGAGTGKVRAAPINTGKIALLKVAFSPKKGRRVFRSPHSLFAQHGRRGRCHGLGYFAHYTMTTQYMGAIRAKLERFEWERTVRDDYILQLAFLDAHVVGAPPPSRAALEAAGITGGYIDWLLSALAMANGDLRRHPWCASPPAHDTCEKTIEDAEGS